MSKPVATNWRNRIVGHGEEDAAKLLPNPKNWRIHGAQQQKALGAVLDEVGWVQDVIVNKRTGHMIDGHLRVALAMSKGERVPVLYVDLSLEEEKLILATIDPLGTMAVSDTEKLNALLEELTISNEPLDALLYSLATDSENSGFKDEPTEGSANGSGNERKLGDSKTQIKPVLYVDEIAIFERAIRATGEINRGKALMRICSAYLSETKGQLDIQSEGYAALESLIRA